MPLSQLHQWVNTRASVGTATLEGIREGLSGERRDAGDAAAALNGLVPAGRRAQPLWMRASRTASYGRTAHVRLEDRKAGAWRRGCSSVETHCRIVPHCDEPQVPWKSNGSSAAAQAPANF